MMRSGAVTFVRSFWSARLRRKSKDLACKSEFGMQRSWPRATCLQMQVHVNAKHISTRFECTEALTSCTTATLYMLASAVCHDIDWEEEDACH